MDKILTGLDSDVQQAGGDSKERENVSGVGGKEKTEGKSKALRK